jgi:hypothetical protein
MIAIRTRDLVEHKSPVPSDAVIVDYPLNLEQIARDTPQRRMFRALAYLQHVILYSKSTDTFYITSPSEIKTRPHELEQVQELLHRFSR